MAGAEIQMVILLIATSLVVVICSIPLVVSNVVQSFFFSIIRTAEPFLLLVCACRTDSYLAGAANCSNNFKAVSIHAW